MALANMHDNAAAAYKEALENWRTMPAQDSLQYNTQLAHTLYNYAYGHVLDLGFGASH